MQVPSAAPQIVDIKHPALTLDNPRNETRVAIEQLNGTPMKILSMVVASIAFFLCLLTANFSGAAGYTLTVGAQGSGTVTPDNTNNPHPPGVTITITAAPNAGWYFASWSGDASGNVNPLQVTMNSNLSVTGNFVAYPTYSLALATNG